MYEALYRKYRPKTFDDVVGQDHITTILKQQVITQKLNHAYLFIGTRGTGKTSCARIMAKAINCEHPVNGNPCNCCSSCIGIEQNTVMDVVEMDAASNNGVDDVRRLQEEAVFSPTTAKKRVYIIDEVHMLSKPAFNALLKILEEPPEHLVFILATTELNKVLPTILSRCQRYNFRRMTAEIVSARLQYVAEKENIRLDEDAALLLGRLAEGGMRDGLSLLDQCAAKNTAAVDMASVLDSMGLAGGYRIQKMANMLSANDTEGVLEEFHSLWMDGKDPLSLLKDLSGFFRDALMLRLAPVGGRNLISGLFSEQELLSVPLNEGALLNMLNTIERYQSTIKDAPTQKLHSELCLMELCGVKQSVAAREPSPVTGITEIIASNAVRDGVASLPSKKEIPPFKGQETRQTLQEQPVTLKNESQVEITGKPSATDVSWGDILMKLKQVIPVSVFSILAGNGVFGEIDNGVITVYASSPFEKKMIENPNTLSLIKEASGMNVLVKGQKENRSGDIKKLEELAARHKDIVRFE